MLKQISESDEGYNIPDKFLSKPKISSLGDPWSSLIFSTLHVSPSVDDNLRIFDNFIVGHENDANDSSCGILYLIHYLLPTPDVRHIRGIVLLASYENDSPSVKVFITSYPYTEEITLGDFERKGDLANPSDDDIIWDDEAEITSAIEGTILRVRQFPRRQEGESEANFVISTHRRLDGLQSRWTGPTFGETFEQIWPHWKDEIEDMLFPDVCYVFLLSAPENRLVCDISFPRLRLVAMYVPDAHNPTQLIRVPHTDHDRYLPPRDVPFEQVPLISVPSRDAFIEFAKKQDSQQTTGLLYVRGDVTLKVILDEYQVQREIRGNEPNLALRYLTLLRRNDGSADKLRKLYPISPVFDTVINQYVGVITHLERCYRTRYYSRTFVMLPKDDHYVITTTRNQYNRSKSLHDNILAVFGEIDTRQIWNMMGRLASTASSTY